MVLNAVKRRAEKSCKGAAGEQIGEEKIRRVERDRETERECNALACEMTI